MIFKQWEQVLSGTKTQTRRLVKQHDYAVNSDGCILPNPEWGDDEIIAVYDKNGRSRWQAWDLTTRAVQPGRGKKAVGRIHITRIRQQRLQDIRELDAEAEMGFRVPIRHFMWGVTTKSKFAKLWNSIHTKKETRWEDNPEVWVLEFEVAR